jgi:hypothetical protein
MILGIAKDCVPFVSELWHHSSISPANPDGNTSTRSVPSVQPAAVPLRIDSPRPLPAASPPPQPRHSRFAPASISRYPMPIPNLVRTKD